jgi:hypothetical protein
VSNTIFFSTGHRDRPLADRAGEDRCDAGHFRLAFADGYMHTLLLGQTELILFHPSGCPCQDGV